MVQLLWDDCRQVSSPTFDGPAPTLPYSPAWLVALGNFVFKTRDALFPVVLIGLIVLTTPNIFHGSVTQSRWIDLLGVLVALSGQLLRVAVIGYRYIVRGGRNREVYAEGLVTTGYFALSRNPLYVGNLLILLGLFLIWHSVVMMAIGIPFFLLGYRAIVAAEEAYLGRQYGADYARYCAATPRWWPRLADIRAATEGMEFNWKRVVLKEYGSAAYWMAGAAVLLAYKTKFYTRVSNTPYARWPYYAIVAVVVVLWGTARFLKKTKRLREA